MTTKQTSLQRLKRMCEDACPKPWTYDERIGCVAVYAGHKVNCIDETKGSLLYYASGYKNEKEEWEVSPHDCANARFIASSRTAMPALIELCEALERRLIAISPTAGVPEREDDLKGSRIDLAEARSRLEATCPK